MADGFNIKVNIDIADLLQEEVETLINDDESRIAIHDTYGKMIEPWVPMDTGHLAQSPQATPQYLRYPGPYAHYMYVGEVYGPNIPIKDELTGEIIGWWSPPQKQPTGRKIQYSTEQHPLACAEWDKVAMQTKKQDFIETVKGILQKRMKEING